MTIADVRRFINILPDWEELSVGLDAIVLAENDDCMGWHWEGVVAICSWEREVIQDWDKEFVEEHVEILDRLGVRLEPIENDPEGILCHFDEASVKGFQLMHILLHELGHHRDRMTTKSQENAARGEPYAEKYAIELADKMWESYFREFNW